ncbi:MAG: putative spermidine/putrescine transport system permease protein [Myxococcales bacterium]|nr:putative spermidine/putrescine transport system permease protein [Myxococcales bacterium]
MNAVGSSAATPARRASPWAARAWNGAVLGLMTFFLINVALIVASVATSSVARRWFKSWLPDGYTTSWYLDAWKEFQLADVLLVTVQIVLCVVVLALLIGLPAAYALARREFPGKRFLMGLFLLPLMIPPITYGIPLATVMYRLNLAGTLTGVIIANLLPTLPFVILVMTPFIEQIDTNLESAARVFGAKSWQVFRHVLVPLLMPGILAASLLVLVRTISMFELTFLTGGPSTQTLVVALYYAVFAAGVRAPQSIDAMAIIYMAVTLTWLLIAMRFVSPTQLVSRVRDPPPGA